MFFFCYENLETLYEYIQLPTSVPFDLAIFAIRQ